MRQPLAYILSAFFISGALPANAIGLPEFGLNPVPPLVFDVWVDGEHSIRTAVLGVPVSGDVGADWVSFMPRADPDAAFDLVVEIHVILLEAGSHTVGVGYRYHNGGANISGEIGDSFFATFVWNGAMRQIAVPSLNCDHHFDVAIGGPVDPPGLTTVLHAVLYSRGAYFDTSDDVYAEARGSFLGETIRIRSTDCGGEQKLHISPSDGLDGADLKVYDWTIDLWDDPGDIIIDEVMSYVWSDGWEVSLTEGASGAFHGTVQKGVLLVPISGEFSNLVELDVAWKEERPFALIGTQFQNPNDGARIVALNWFETEITQLPNGYVFYENSGIVPNVLVGPKTCQSAYLGTLVECAPQGSHV